MRGISEAQSTERRYEIHLDIYAVQNLQRHPMTTRLPDYTTRGNYQKNYAKANREAINARKRAWRKSRQEEGKIGRAELQTTGEKIPYLGHMRRKS